MQLNRKNKLLLFGFLVVLYFSYSFAISKTIFYYNQYQSQSEQLNTIENSPKTLSLLKFKERQIDKWLLLNNSSSNSFQNELLKELTTYSENHDLKIIDFVEPHKFSDNGSTVTSYSFAVEGSFNGVLALINRIENKSNLGVITHINSVKNINFKTNQDYLTTTIIIQKSEANSPSK